MEVGHGLGGYKAGGWLLRCWVWKQTSAGGGGIDIGSRKRCCTRSRIFILATYRFACKTCGGDITTRSEENGTHLCSINWRISAYHLVYGNISTGEGLA